MRLRKVSVQIKTTSSFKHAATRADFLRNGENQHHPQRFKHATSSRTVLQFIYPGRKCFAPAEGKKIFTEQISFPASDVKDLLWDERHLHPQRQIFCSSLSFLDKTLGERKERVFAVECHVTQFTALKSVKSRL